MASQVGLAALVPSAAPPGDAATSTVEGRTYSDTFTPLRDDVRAYERDPANRYTYCIRNVATYECLSYGSDGAIRRQQHLATAHGTGFAYKNDGDQTRLLTNQHVVSWPTVTDDENHVEDVPSGCKLVSQNLSIVDNDEDEYGEDDIPLTRVLDDAALDVAVVRAPSKLRLLPYRVGRSSALSTGDVVIVRGFPLGVFQAYNTGKVINTYDRDLYRHWDHVDFIVDAQLSSGNSGSPVLALNRRTGEYELVGVFHASYARANGLNAVIATDQLQDFMFQLKKPTQSRLSTAIERLPDAEQRQRLQKALEDRDFVPYVALGSLFVRLHGAGDSLLFEVFSSKFPLDDSRVAFLLDTPESNAWGKLQRVWFGNGRGYKPYVAANLDVESQECLKRVLKRLYEMASATLRYRQQASHSADSRQTAEQRSVQKKAWTRAAAQDPDLVQQLLELAAKSAPSAAGETLTLSSVFAQAVPPPSPRVALRPPPEQNGAGPQLLVKTPSPDFALKPNLQLLK